MYNNWYTLPRVYNLPIVIYSNILWEVFKEAQDNDIDCERFNKALKQYLKSSLHSEVLNSTTPKEYKGSITECLHDLLGINNPNEEGYEDCEYFTIRFEGQEKYEAECYEQFYTKYTEVFDATLFRDAETIEYERRLMEHIFFHTPKNSNLEDEDDFDLMLSDTANVIMNVMNAYFLQGSAEKCNFIDFATKSLKYFLKDNYINYMKSYGLV